MTQTPNYATHPHTMKSYSSAGVTIEPMLATSQILTQHSRKKNVKGIWGNDTLLMHLEAGDIICMF